MWRWSHAAAYRPPYVGKAFLFGTLLLSLCLITNCLGNGESMIAGANFITYTSLGNLVMGDSSTMRYSLHESWLVMDWVALCVSYVC